MLRAPRLLRWAVLPVLQPQLFTEVDFFAADCATAAGGSSPEFLLASGDTTGLGWHSDFVAGWNENLLDRVINSGADECTQSIDNCKPLQHTGPEDAAKIPNGSMLGSKFCSPLVAFPNGACRPLATRVPLRQARVTSLRMLTPAVRTRS